MAYGAHVIADSISPRGDRLTTLEVTLPRPMLAEFNTHRMLSRNSASSRAIPVEVRLREAIDDPFIPEVFGKNRPGMQSEEELSPEDQARAKIIWLWERDMAVIGATAMVGGVDNLKDQGLQERIKRIIEEHKSPPPLVEPMHKQLANRVLEPYVWATVIVSASEWENFYALRAHEAAQQEISKAAQLMQQVYGQSTPVELEVGQWHLPLIREDDMELPLDMLVKMSVGRCARISYLTHAGIRDPQEDVNLHDKLLQDGHMSPFEHVARPARRLESVRSKYRSNFRGWIQYRKTIAHEANFADALRSRIRIGELSVSDQIAA